VALSQIKLIELFLMTFSLPHAPYLQNETETGNSKTMKMEEAKKEVNEVVMSEEKIGQIYFLS
jgi:hypothetical protein